MGANTSSRRRVPSWLIWLAVPVVGAGLGFAWWTISPLFITTTVDEAFPTTVAAAPSPAPASPPTAVPAATLAPALPTDDPAVSNPALTAAPAEPTAAPSEPTVAPSEPTVAPSEPTAAPAGPIALASGNFTVIDRLHGAEGVATIYALPDGQRILRLENFRAQNGPDLRIGLAGHPMPRSSAELHDTGAGYVELDRLTASAGNQNYAIPADLDLVDFQSVVIYCRAFSVVFSTAELM